MLRGSAGQQTKEGGGPRHTAKEKRQADGEQGMEKVKAGEVSGKKEGNSPHLARSVLHRVKCPCSTVQGHAGTP